MDAVLCYVEGSWAYFTTQTLDKQWGDDWDDAPYEHNAGRPYDAGRYYYADGTIKPIPSDWNDDGTPKWRIYTVAFEGNLYPPCDEGPNSNYCVRDINTGAVAWLRSQYANPPIVIPAGTTLRDFIGLVQRAAGVVYLPVEGQLIAIVKQQIAKRDKIAGASPPSMQKRVAAQGEWLDEVLKRLAPWIPVGERLPEAASGTNSGYSVSVIATDGKESGEAYWSMDNQPVWRSAHGERWPGVTHWQPLPAPPKREEKP